MGMLRALVGAVALAGLAGCATTPDRCYIVLDKQGVKAELCQTRDKLHLFGTPQVTEDEIPPYVKGLLAYEGIAYTEDPASHSTSMGSPLTR